MKQILHYNTFQNTLKSDLEKKYKKFDYNTRICFVDRYQQIPHYLPVTSYSKPLQSDPSFNEYFDHLCDRRSIELLNTGKIINVFWSGGLDSTAVLISLIMNCTNKDQIRIITSYNAILESGYFYETFLKSYNTIFDISGINKYFNENELFITGNPGNQLFSSGSMSISKLVKDVEDLKKSYKDIISVEDQEFYYPSLIKSPRPVVSYEDFLWYRNFATLWEHPRFHLIIRYLKPKNVKKYLNIVLGFFYTNYFEQWAINNNEQQHELKDINNFLTSTKLPMRKYIFKKLGQKSEDYVKNKKIVSSIWVPNGYSYKYITTDFEVHYDE
jgi:hypothetical protein